MFALTGCPATGVQPPPAAVVAPAAVAAADKPAVWRFFALSGNVTIAQRPMAGASLRLRDAATGQLIPFAASFPAAEQDPMGVVSQTASTDQAGQYRLVLTNPRPGAVLVVEASDGSRTASSIVVLPRNADAARYGVLQDGSAGGAALGGSGGQSQPVVSGAEQIAQAEAIQKRGVQLAERLSKMLSEARRDKDILRVNCLNRKLTEVNATSDTIGQRVRDLGDANAGNDEGRRNHEFTVLTVLAQKLDALDQEAAQCLGQGVYEPGASQIVTTISPNAPTGNQPNLPAPPAAPPSLTVPPPAGSPGEGNPPQAPSSAMVVPITDVTTALTFIANQMVTLAKTGGLTPEQFSSVVSGLILDLNPAMQKVHDTLDANPSLSQALTTGSQSDSAAQAALNTALADVKSIVTKAVSNAVQGVVTQTTSPNVLEALAGQTIAGVGLTFKIGEGGKTVSLVDIRTGQVITVDVASGTVTDTTPPRHSGSRGSTPQVDPPAIATEALDFDGVGQTATFVDTSADDVTATSSATSVATVEETGDDEFTVTAVGAGTATITVRNSGGTDTVTVKVTTTKVVIQ